MNKKILVFFLFLAILSLPIVCSAAGGASDIKGIVTKISESLSGLGVALATIGFVVSGITYIMATTNPSLTSVAKGSLVAAVIGITIVLLAANACTFVQTFTGAGSCT